MTVNWTELCVHGSLETDLAPNDIEGGATVFCCEATGFDRLQVAGGVFSLLPP